jgi:hypothetical protein
VNPITAAIGERAMRVFAASFMTKGSATSALHALNRLLGTSDTVRIAPLGDRVPGGPTMVLAGRFEDDVIAAVRRAVAGMGGTIVVDVDEGADQNA